MGISDIDSYLIRTHIHFQVMHYYAASQNALNAQSSTLKLKNFMAAKPHSGTGLKARLHIAPQTPALKPLTAPLSKQQSLRREQVSLRRWSREWRPRRHERHHCRCCATRRSRNCRKRRLTLSPPIPLRLYTLPNWSNPPFLPREHMQGRSWKA